MTVRVKYSSRFHIAILRLFNHVVKNFADEKKLEKLKGVEKRNLQIRIDAIKTGKAKFYWDEEDDNVFYLEINDPILEPDAIKEWGGENFKKKYALKFSRRYLQAHGIRIELLKE